MKKLISLALCLVMLFSLVSCSVEVKKEAVADDNSVTFDEIEAANTYENLIRVYGCFRYDMEYNGEPADQTRYYDGYGEFTYYDFAEDDRIGYYKTSDSVYYYNNGTITAYLDPVSAEPPIDNMEYYAVEFRSDDFDEVESLEKTDTGYLITFEGDAEDAEFFRDENYVEGDLFYVCEAVHEDLTFDYMEQYILCADGTRISLNKTTLVPCALPDFAVPMKEGATADDRITATIVTRPGTDYEGSCSVMLRRNDPLRIDDFGYNLFDDAECTIPHVEGTEDTSADLTVYGIWYEDLYQYEDGQVAFTEFREYNADGEETYFESHRYDPDGNEIEGVSSGDKGENNPAYAESDTFDSNYELISHERIDY